MWSAANQATGDWLLFTDADVLFKSRRADAELWLMRRLNPPTISSSFPA